jgi:hypothetical protein
MIPITMTTTIYSFVCLCLLFNACTSFTSPLTIGKRPFALQATVRDAGGTTGSTSTLDEKQRDFTLGYLNKHHGDFLLKLAEVFSDLGAEMAIANGWSGESFIMEQATIQNIDTVELELNVDVKRRGKPDTSEIVKISLNADPISEKQRNFPSIASVPDDSTRLAIDDVTRRLCRLCWITKVPEVSGKLAQLAIQLSGAGVGELPESMFLNQVPHNRYVRQYFYENAAKAVLDAVVLCSEGKISNRMKVISQFPEMNPEMDSYRIGTILEMVRAIGVKLAEENLRVRVCVQGSMVSIKYPDRHCFTLTFATSTHSSLCFVL